jgi:hypothetical protein
MGAKMQSQKVVGKPEWEGGDTFHTKETKETKKSVPDGLARESVIAGFV